MIIDNGIITSAYYALAKQPISKVDLVVRQLVVRVRKCVPEITPSKVHDAPNWNRREFFRRTRQHDKEKTCA